MSDPKYVLISHELDEVVAVSDSLDKVLSAMAHEKIKNMRDTVLYERYEVKKPWV